MDNASETIPAPPSPTQVIEYEPSHPKRNPSARRSVMYGLMLFVPFITGAFAIREARWGFKTAAVNGAGRRTAEAGLVLGVANLVLWVFLAVALPPEIIRMREGARQVACLSQMRQMAADVFTYSTVNKGWFPPTLNAKGVRVFSCPNVSGPSNYVYVLGGMRQTTAVPTATFVMMYEPPGNHPHAVNFAYADGHCESIPTATAVKVMAELSAGFNPPRAEKLK
jgi:prepilin-type processing-associated H-X9-DG protein